MALLRSPPTTHSPCYSLRSARDHVLTAMRATGQTFNQHNQPCCPHYHLDVRRQLGHCRLRTAHHQRLAQGASRRRPIEEARHLVEPTTRAFPYRQAPADQCIGEREVTSQHHGSTQLTS